MYGYNLIVLVVGIILVFGIASVVTVLPHSRYTYGIQNDVCKSAAFLGDMALPESDLADMKVMGSSTLQNRTQPSTLRQFVKEVRALEHEIQRTKKRFCKHKQQCKTKRKSLEKKLRHFRQAKLQFENVISGSEGDTSHRNHTGSGYSRRKRSAISDKSKLWPEAIIPFVFEDGFSASSITSIKSAMQDWEKETCLVFKEREPSDLNYVIIGRYSCGCCSDVGMIRGGPQMFSLGKGCMRHYVILHELGHLIGFFHEHQRPDRDQYIKVNTDNIKEGMTHDFVTKQEHEVDYLGEPYDYDSIMHYTAAHFSKSKELSTLEAILQEGMDEIPLLKDTPHKLSEGDIRRARKLYSCASCGNTVVDLEGFISHNGTRGKSDTCQWRIMVTLGSRVELDITTLLTPITEDCWRNYLEVRDGSSKEDPLLGRFCGRDAPGIIRSTTERMWVEFKSTSSGQRFVAEHRENCENYNVTKQEGEIHSPRFPRSYPPNANCTWVLRASEGKTIYVKFAQFSVASLRRVCEDYVEFRDGPSATSPLIGQYCKRTPEPIQSTGPELFIRFVSNKRLEKAGFRLQYVQEVDECEQEPSPCGQVCENTMGSFICTCNLAYELHSDGRQCIPRCGGVYRSGSGTITSPSFPDLYSPDKSCRWLLQAPPQYTIFMDFHHFDIEGDLLLNQCDKDYLEITEGPDKLLVGKFCGFLNPSRIISAKGTVRLHFVSDNTMQSSGFNMTYHIDKNECAEDNGGCNQGCRNTIGGYECTCLSGYSLLEDGKSCETLDQCSFTINQPRGTFASVNFPLKYPGRQDCTWLVTTLVGHRVRVKFKTFNLEMHSRCRYDHLAIHDGKDDQTPLLAKYCGYEIPDPVTSSSNQMFLYFFSDASRQYWGFYIEYDSVCSGDVAVTTESQTLVSHGDYGRDNYDNRQTCHWSLEADPGYVIEVLFDEFDVEFEDSCGYDSVKFFDGDSDGDPELGTFCGDEVSGLVVSTGSSMLIRFTTDDTLTTPGFKLIFYQRRP